MKKLLLTTALFGALMTSAQAPVGAHQVPTAGRPTADSQR
jgi:hypothetical protein